MERKIQAQYPRTPRRNYNKRSWPKNEIMRLVEEERRDKPVPENCICQRSKRVVLCSVCSFSIIGRVRTVCPDHPQTIFLMDLDRCPRCLGYSNILKEYE